MKSALQIQVVVPADHRLEIVLPEEIPEGPAEVIVLTEERRSQDRKQSLGVPPSANPGWKKVFGKAQWEEVAEIDAIVGEELERVEPDDWR
jgi:hypothetical protein